MNKVLSWLGYTVDDEADHNGLINSNVKCIIGIEGRSFRARITRECDLGYRVR